MLFLLSFIGAWLLSYFTIMIALSKDNINWITSSPEWDNKSTVINQFGSWTGPVNKYSWKDYFNYVFKYRVWSVFTDYRDRWPAISSSFWMAWVIHKHYFVGISGLIITLIVWVFYVKLNNGGEDGR